MAKDMPSANRRSFLKLGGLTAAAGAAAAVTATSAEAASQPLKATEAGYRETDHVKQVYELSRF